MRAERSVKVSKIATRRSRPLTILWLLAIALLAGCAGRLHWTKTGATADDFNRDSYECAQQHSRDSFTWRPPIAGGPSYGPEVNKDLYRACMQARGYQRVE